MIETATKTIPEQDFSEQSDNTPQEIDAVLAQIETQESPSEPSDEQNAEIQIGRFQKAGEKLDNSLDAAHQKVRALGRFGLAALRTVKNAAVFTAASTYVAGKSVAEGVANKTTLAAASTREFAGKTVDYGTDLLAAAGAKAEMARKAREVRRNDRRNERTTRAAEQAEADRTSQDARAAYQADYAAKLTAYANEEDGGYLFRESADAVTTFEPTAAEKIQDTIATAREKAAAAMMRVQARHETGKRHALDTGAKTLIGVKKIGGLFTRSLKNTRGRFSALGTAVKAGTQAYRTTVEQTRV